MQRNDALRSRFWKYLFYCGAVALIMLGNFALHARHSQSLLGPNGYQLSGSFAPNGSLPPSDGPTKKMHNFMLAPILEMIGKLEVLFPNLLLRRRSLICLLQDIPAQTATAYTCSQLLRLRS